MLFLVSIALNFVTFRTKRYRRDPNPRAFAEAYWDKSRKEMQEQLTANLIECYEINESILTASAQCIKYSMYSTLIGLAFLVASVLKN